MRERERERERESERDVGKLLYCFKAFSSPQKVQAKSLKNVGVL